MIFYENNYFDAAIVDPHSTPTIINFNKAIKMTENIAKSYQQCFSNTGLRKEVKVSAIILLSHCTAHRNSLSNISTQTSERCTIFVRNGFILYSTVLEQRSRLQMGNCCVSNEGYDANFYDRESTENERRSKKAKNCWRTCNDCLRFSVQL